MKKSASLMILFVWYRVVYLANSCTWAAIRILSPSTWRLAHAKSHVFLKSDNSLAMTSAQLRAIPTPNSQWHRYSMFRPGGSHRENTLIYGYFENSGPWNTAGAGIPRCYERWRFKASGRSTTKPILRTTYAKRSWFHPGMFGRTDQEMVYVRACQRSYLVISTTTTHLIICYYLRFNK
jgi:hypothetical protein